MLFLLYQIISYFNFRWYCI